MPQYSVKVKWGKELFPNVEVNTDEEPILFKAQLFALTGVQPKRQKVMLKGKTLKDDDWGNVALKDGITVLMMGSKEEDLPSEPKEQPLFLEDMSESEIATALHPPAGLVNLGNTCYLNATLQCLKSVPELREALRNSVPGVTNVYSPPAQLVTAALKDIYESMDRGKKREDNWPPSPFFLFKMMHFAFPRFAEKSADGGYQQQDANECWTEVMRMLQQTLPAKENPALTEGEPQASKPRSFIEQYFGGTFETELKCNETDKEPPTKGKEDFLQLSCFISTDVIYMITGLRSKMKETITKMSPTLGRDAVYTKTSKISRLPAYLTIQFVRFYYKEKEAINAKILKEVKFPFVFDAYILCSDELQAKLAPMREKYKSQENNFHNSYPKSSVKNAKDRQQFSFPDDLGSNNSAYYSLQAVITHKGRSCSSGHYVAWIRQGKDTWLKYDDDFVTVVRNADILKLTGGGDWHCAYVLLYGPHVIDLSPSEEAEATAETTADD